MAVVLITKEIYDSFAEIENMLNFLVLLVGKDNFPSLPTLFYAITFDGVIPVSLSSINPDEPVFTEEQKLYIIDKYIRKLFVFNASKLKTCSYKSEIQISILELHNEVKDLLERWSKTMFRDTSIMSKRKHKLETKLLNAFYEINRYNKPLTFIQDTLVSFNPFIDIDDPLELYFSKIYVSLKSMYHLKDTIYKFYNKIVSPKKELKLASSHAIAKKSLSNYDSLEIPKGTLMTKFKGGIAVSFINSDSGDIDYDIFEQWLLDGIENATINIINFDDIVMSHKFILLGSFQIRRCSDKLFGLIQYLESKWYDKLVKLSLGVFYGTKRRFIDSDDIHMLSYLKCKIPIQFVGTILANPNLFRNLNVFILSGNLIAYQIAIVKKIKQELKMLDYGFDCINCGVFNCCLDLHNMTKSEQDERKNYSFKCFMCNTDICLKCNKTFHGGLCNYVIDPETAALIQTTSTSCPGCNINITKTEGCNHITCSITIIRNALGQEIKRKGCGMHFCYLCGDSLIDPRTGQLGDINPHFLDRGPYNDMCVTLATRERLAMAQIVREPGEVIREDLANIESDNESDNGSDNSEPPDLIEGPEEEQLQPAGEQLEPAGEQLELDDIHQEDFLIDIDRDIFMNARDAVDQILDLQPQDYQIAFLENILSLSLRNLKLLLLCIINERDEHGINYANVRRRLDNLHINNNMMIEIDFNILLSAYLAVLPN